MKSIWRYIFRILGGIILLAVLFVCFFLYKIAIPKSDDKIREAFEKEKATAYLQHKKFRNFEYRVIASQEHPNAHKPTVVFIHGSIGSGMDFKRYLTDQELLDKANLITYDRVGYGVKHRGEVQESIAFEADLLEDLLEGISTDNCILVGYSYGGPIALASGKNYKNILLIAPAVYGDVEPMPWAINFYKWKMTRWLIPKAWKATSREKISHKEDLKNFEDTWGDNPNDIISVHGLNDWIVPYANSIYLEENIPDERFELVPLNDVGHGLVWSQFEEIKSIILQVIEK